MAADPLISIPATIITSIERKTRHHRFQPTSIQKRAQRHRIEAGTNAHHAAILGQQQTVRVIKGKAALRRVGEPRPID